MAGKRLAHDATASALGTIHSLYVAVEKCFEMVSGQKVILERYGDVTINASQQLEIKRYTEPLTDNHENFWKTLKNWMQEGFDETAYSALILCTTQVIGAEARLKEWNSLDADGRFQILKEILLSSEERHSNRQKKNDSSATVPDSLRLQREILNITKAAKLRNVVTKFTIADHSPDTGDLYDRIGDVYAKGILLQKRDDFLNALLGFVICPPVISNGWQISYDEFSNKVAELTAQYCRGTTQFPTKYFPGRVAVNVSGRRKELFVKKIEEIRYKDIIPKAVNDYFYASETVLKELRDYEVPMTRYQTFKTNVEDQFQPHFRRASRSITDVIKQSQDFYDAVMMQPSPSFPGFEDPPLSFRNGVIHMLANDPSKDIKWRLGS